MLAAVAGGCASPAPSPLLRAGEDAPLLSASIVTVQQALAPRPVTLFVNFDGATIRKAGASDATKDQSFVCGATIAPFDHRPYGADRKQVIDGVISALAAYYAGLRLEIVSSRPASGPYQMLIVGGAPKDCGLDGFFGLSPLDCDNRSAADIAFVFSAAITAVQGLALVGAHEVGHTLGLPHVLDGCDVMSNFVCSTGGAKRFLDQNMVIAPDHRGRCGGGDKANSRALLRAALGQQPSGVDGGADARELADGATADLMLSGGSEGARAGSGCQIGGGAAFCSPILLLFFLYWWQRRHSRRHARDALAAGRPT